MRVRDIKLKIEHAKQKAPWLQSFRRDNPCFKKIDLIVEDVFKRYSELNTSQVCEIILAVCEFRDSPAASTAEPWLKDFFDDMHSTYEDLIKAIEIEKACHERQRKRSNQNAAPSNINYSSFEILYSSLIRLDKSNIDPSNYLTAANARAQFLLDYYGFTLFTPDGFLKNWIEILENERILTKQNVDTVLACSGWSHFSYNDTENVVKALSILEKNKLLALKYRQMIEHISRRGNNPVHAVNILMILREAKLLEREENNDFFTFNEGNIDQTIYALTSQQAHHIFLNLDSLHKNYSKENALTQHAFDILKLACTTSCPALIAGFWGTLKILNAVNLTAEHKRILSELMHAVGDQFHESGLSHALYQFHESTLPLTQHSFEILIGREDHHRHTIAIIMKKMQTVHKMDLALNVNQEFLKSVKNPKNIDCFLRRAFFREDFENNFIKLRNHHSIFSELNLAQIPDYLFGQEQFDHIIDMCENHQGPQHRLVNQVRQYLFSLLPEEDRPDNNQIYDPQNTHDVIISKTVRESAYRLFQRYREGIEGEKLNEVISAIEKWVADLPGEDAHPLCLMKQLPLVENHPQEMISIITPQGLFQLNRKKGKKEYKLVLSPQELRSLQLERFLEQAEHLTEEKINTVTSELSRDELIQLDELVKTNPKRKQRGRTRHNTALVDERLIAKRCINRLLYHRHCSVLNFSILEQGSEISNHQLLAVIWLGVQECIQKGVDGFDQETADIRLLQGFHEIQRGYNLVRSREDIVEKQTPETKIEDDFAIKEDGYICSEGTFNKLVTVLQTVHPDVEIIVQNHETANLKFISLLAQSLTQFLKNYAKENKPEKCQEMARQIEWEMNKSKFKGNHWDLIIKITREALLKEFNVLYEKLGEEDPHLRSLFTSEVLDLTCDRDEVRKALEEFLTKTEIAEQEGENEVPLDKEKEKEKEAEGDQEKEKGKEKMPHPYRVETPRKPMPPLVADTDGAPNNFVTTPTEQKTGLPMSPYSLFSAGGVQTEVPAFKKGTDAPPTTEQVDQEETEEISIDLREKKHSVDGAPSLREKENTDTVESPKDKHIAKLEAYCAKRKEEARERKNILSKDFHHWYACLFGGFDGQVKVETAEYLICLLNSEPCSIQITPRHIAAAHDHRLKDLLNEIMADGLLTEDDLVQPVIPAKARPLSNNQ